MKGVTMIDKLKVNQKIKPDGVPIDDVMLSWEASDEKQFTVEMCLDAEFTQTVMYLDTRNLYVRYDGLPLKRKKIYYWRVRTGIGEWVVSKFITD